MAAVGLLLAVAQLGLGTAAPARATRRGGVSTDALRSLDASLPSRSTIDASRVGDAGHKGLGLFAAADIEPGTSLGFYEGELLTQSQYCSRYPEGQSRYAFLLLDSCQRRERIYIDSADPSRSNLARFMNHGSEDCNVASRTRHWDLITQKSCLGFSSHERCAGVCSKLGKGIRITAIEFVSQRLIFAGEELLFDYGDLYTSFL